VSGAPLGRLAVHRLSDRRSRPGRASTPAKSSRRRASAPRAPTRPRHAARSEYDAPSVRTADASDIGLQLPARYGQNDREIALGRKNHLFAGSDGGGDTKTFKRGMDTTIRASTSSSARIPHSSRQPHWNCWLGNLACSPQPNPQPSDGRRLTPWRLSRAPGAGQLEEARSLRPPQFA
jgi:hypothetical protein